MSNSVIISENIKSDFEALKNNRDHKYVVYKIEGTTGPMILEKEKEVLGREMTSPDDIETLLEEDMEDNCCRFVVLDFRFLNPYDAQVDKFILLIWCPAACNPGEQDLYYGCRNMLRQTLTGLAKEYIVNYPEDVTYEQMKQDVGE